MCGFVGVVRHPEAGGARPEDVERHRAFIARRGPDGQGSFVAGGIALAASRLAVQGGPEANQPLVSRDGRFVLAYNGELLASHRRRLRGAIRAEGGGEARASSDTALLLAWLVHRLADRGAGDPIPAGTVEALSGGMYAFALADLHRQEVILHTDGSIKPLYVLERQDQKETWFSSTLSPLLSLERGRLAVDVFEWAYRIVSPEGSGPLAAGPGRLAAVGARVLSVSVAGAGHRPRVLLEAPHAPTGSAAADSDDLKQAVEEAAREAAEVTGPVTVFLSGGLDSAAVATACGRKDALAVTGRFSPWDGDLDESAPAAAVARAAGIAHEIVDLLDRDLLADLPRVIEALEEPAGGPGSLAIHRIARRARAHGRVALSGTGGDERFAGYARVALALSRSGPWTSGYERLAERMARAGEDPRKRWLAAVDRSDDVLPFLDPAFREAFPIAAARRRVFQDLFGEETGADALAPVRALCRAEERTTLPMLLRVEDRVTMSLGLESRPVLCLGRVPEVAHRLSEDALVGPDGEGKRAFREALRGAIPEAVRTDTRKRGFPTPFHRAARGAGRDLAEAILCDRRFRERGWWDAAACRALLSEDRPHHDRALFSILSLEIWARLFLDGDALAVEPEPAAGRGAT